MSSKVEWENKDLERAVRNVDSLFEGETPEIFHKFFGFLHWGQLWANGRLSDEEFQILEKYDLVSHRKLNVHKDINFDLRTHMLEKMGGTHRDWPDCVSHLSKNFQTFDEVKPLLDRFIEMKA